MERILRKLAVSSDGDRQMVKILAAVLTAEVLRLASALPISNCQRQFDRTGSDHAWLPRLASFTSIMDSGRLAADQGRITKWACSSAKQALERMHPNGLNSDYQLAQRATKTFHGFEVWSATAS